MDQLGSRLKQLSNELREYVETRLELLVLTVGDQVSQWIAQSTQKIIGFSVIGCGLFFGMMALAIYLGDLLKNDAIGYLIVAAFLLLVGLVLFIAKPFGIAKSIQKQLMSGILEALEDEKPSEKLVITEPKKLQQGKENE